MARLKESGAGDKHTEQVEKSVRVFSQRRGDIILSNGDVFKFGDVLKVTHEMAEWLDKSFPKMVKVIE